MLSRALLPLRTRRKQFGGNAVVSVDAVWSPPPDEALTCASLLARIVCVSAKCYLWAFYSLFDCYRVRRWRESCPHPSDLYAPLLPTLRWVFLGTVWTLGGDDSGFCIGESAVARTIGLPLTLSLSVFCSMCCLFYLPPLTW